MIEKTIQNVFEKRGHGKFGIRCVHVRVDPYCPWKYIVDLEGEVTSRHRIEIQECMTNSCVDVDKIHDICDVFMNKHRWGIEQAPL